MHYLIQFIYIMLSAAIFYFDILSMWYYVFCDILSVNLIIIFEWIIIYNHYNL